MDLIINGRKAVLKQGSSFTYVSENRSFTDADAYTFSISLPLAGCTENLAIFGHVDRLDIGSRQQMYEASIIDVGFSKHGVITIVDATEAEVKVQFLEGRSVQNFDDTFDNIYINEIDLGEYPMTTLPEYPSMAYSRSDFVALPWVDEDESKSVQNGVERNSNGFLSWTSYTRKQGKLSWQPFLIYIAKSICINRGYTYDFSQWENSQDRYLLVCNALPAAWNIPQFSRALPHWSITEFWEELEKLLACEISIDHKARHISFEYCMSDTFPYSEIKIENVLDAFSAEVSSTDEISKFKGLANVRYKGRDDEKWRYEQCQWFIDFMRQDAKFFKEFPTWEAYYAWQRNTLGDSPLTPGLGLLPSTTKNATRGPEIGRLFYIAEEDVYFFWKVVPGSLSQYVDLYYYQSTQVNQFGDVVRDPDSDNNIEVGMVPARIDNKKSVPVYGKCLFLTPSGFDEEEVEDPDGISQPAAYSTFMQGEDKSAPEYYDTIYLAYWDNHDTVRTWGLIPLSLPEGEAPPLPTVDKFLSLRRRYDNYLGGVKVAQKERLKVSWISSSIPDVRSIFIIRGKKFLCEKITATFSEDGMSQLLKGEFFAVED